MKKNHYILVSIEIPNDNSHESLSKAQTFVSKTEGISDKSAGIRRLHENTWLLERENGASSLAKIVATAEGLGLQCDVLFLSSDE